MPAPLSTLRTALRIATASAALVFLPITQAQETWADVKKAGVLKCGSAIAAPYVMRDAGSGEYSGLFIELCRDFGEKELGVKVEFVSTTWDNLVAGLQSGSWDLALALNETEQRKRAVNFSTKVIDYDISFVVHKDNAKFAQAGNAATDYDLKGVKFSVMSGTQQDQVISKLVKNGQVQRLPGMDETRLALISKRVDVLVDDSGTNKIFSIANPDWAREVLPNPPLAPTPMSFGIRKSRPAAEVEQLNTYINRRRESGEVEAMLNKAAQQAVEMSKKAS